MSSDDPLLVEALRADAFLEKVLNRLAQMEKATVDSFTKEILVDLVYAGGRQLLAVQLLLRSGMVREAAIVARSIVEAAISAAYVASGNKKQRLERQLMFREHWLSTMEETFARGPSAIPPEKLAAFAKKHAEVRDAFRKDAPKVDKKKRYGWSDEKIREMAKKGGAFATRLYEGPYFMFSNFAHPTHQGTRQVDDAGWHAALIRIVASRAAEALAYVADLAAGEVGIEPVTIDDLDGAYQATHPQLP